MEIKALNCEDVLIATLLSISCSTRVSHYSVHILDITKHSIHNCAAIQLQME
jgi:hypothetical protein